jgi:hypothetical protein
MPSLVRNSGKAEANTYSGTTATVTKDSRSFFNFDVVVEWQERHKFLKCM